MIKRILAIVLVVSLLASMMSACTKEPASSADSSTTPDVTLTIVDEPDNLPEKEETMKNEANGNIASLVCSAVNYDLQDKGYETEECIAFSSDNTYSAVGIGYQNPNLQFFSNSEYEAHGFVTIIGPEDDYIAMPTTCEYVAVEPVDGAFDNGALYNLVAYSCESLGYNHFVYENQYVIYYQLDETTVRYETYENKRENYDLSIGSLYDFDNDVFIYDASLFDGYEGHSGVELFSETDYAALKDRLKAISDAQEQNGYYVEELNVVYISPESIMAYLESEEEDTFFGYSVAELESSIGAGTALVYTENGFETANYFEENSGGYNWKSFLTKVGIGTGIILVGAILTPITGGASFGCALVTISTITVSAAFVEGVGTLAIETAYGLIQGKDFKEALRDASYASLDAFANTFLITAAITTVGVTSGIIKPIACFTAGTLIAVPVNTGVSFKPIEDICIGDTVYSYDERTGSVSVNTVTEVFESVANHLVNVTIQGEVITSTQNHPYYLPEKGSWTAAADLTPGTAVLLLDGTIACVESVDIIYVCDTTVYNFTVANDHSYFVGENSVLVHNKCTTLQAARQAGVDKAWKQEADAIRNGTSRYNWTELEIDEILKNGKLGKEFGYEGCHILDASLYPDLADDPNNIIFLAKEVHFKIVHQGNFANPSNWDEIVKIMPQFADQVADMLKLVS